MKIANQSIGPALDALGYKSNEVDEIISVIGSMSLSDLYKQEFIDGKRIE